MNNLSTKINNRLTPRGMVLLLILLLLIFGSLTGSIFLATRQSTPGTDFFIYYTAAGNITRRGISPYNENVGEESQFAILKRSSIQNEDQLRFVYPPYALLPVLPLANLPFPWAQSIWMAFGFMTLSISFIAAYPKPPLWLVATLLLLYPVFFGFLLGNFDILIISLLFLLLSKIPRLSNENLQGQILAGLPLAWITLKPQFVWFYLIFLGLIIYEKKLKALAVSFSLSLAGLLLISFTITPNWIMEWVSLVQQYPTYTGNQFVFSPLIALFLPSEKLSFAYGFIFVLMSMVLALLIKRHLKGKISSLGLLAFGAFFTYLFHPTDVAYEQLTFLLPVILWIIQIAKTHHRIALGVWLILIFASWVFFFWGRFGGIPMAATSGLFILYTLWLIFGFLVPPKFLLRFDFIH